MIDFERNVAEEVLRLLENYIVVGSEPMLALTSRTSPNTFVKGVKSAGISAQLGIGIGYAHDHYIRDVGDAENSSLDICKAYQDLYFLGKSHMDSTLMRISPVPNVTAGEIFADVALCRLYSTYFSIGLLFRIGKIFEARAICRIFLEQVAWSYTASTCKDYKEATKVLPSRAINKLKNIIPQVGMMYGKLSHDVHLDIKQHKSFLKIEDGFTKVLISHGEDSLLESTILLDLADYWSIIYEYSQRRHYKTFENWIETAKNFILKTDRSFIIRAELEKEKLHKAKS